MGLIVGRFSLSFRILRMTLQDPKCDGALSILSKISEVTCSVSSQGKHLHRRSQKSQTTEAIVVRRDFQNISTHLDFKKL